MSSKIPPVPPAGSSDKGPGDAQDRKRDPARADVTGAQATKAREAADRPANAATQGRQGDININTTHQGRQQAR